ncbi:hypothetical protein PHYSODRAFT_315148 [Phytophthora sojae]|uniref:Protein kinase domain-containing protein n=1 Tax=Phytophthora sojae (strain P6497) TaxID=1094619 RepID=G4ZJA4_PHYSP|nr:hypothetical protein PHYSODRAFT_315148 [Phytophthora sojae]EGZ18178.1 hypothetical protein PHYSODRAFT_315148 [Phytophthora sojae]|eukprot:XP_009527236.1 hypothetical protein PHYSODRAFT_315148 [Phytophthora sojae]
MQMIETQIFSALSETPLPRKLDLPEWFLPDTEVTYEPKPCSRASFGSLHLGACNGTDVVVMCLNDGTGESLQTNERFQRYTTRWHGLDHLHVAKMLGVSHLSSPPLVIYEEVKYNVAGYLADSTNAGSMWRLLYETALGLRYAHNKKVLHGNLKLTTIRVDSEGHAKICGPSRLKSGAVRWQAPECLTGRRTFASVIYSLAMCIIEALSGEPPFGQLDDDTLYATHESVYSSLKLHYDD